jgi:hypothetical protein
MNTQKAALLIIVLVVLIAAPLLYLFYRSGNKIERGADFQSLTPEEVQSVTDSLSTKGKSDLPPEMEKKAVSSLSATSSESKLTPKQESSLLKSLQAPQ